MSAWLNKTKKIIISILIFLLIGSYFVWKKLKDKANDNRYFLTKVQRGNIVVSVSGSGQIKSQEEIDLKAKVSGEISEILVKEGQEIKKGELLFKIDPKNYEKALENAKIAKDTAKQNLETLTQNKNTAEKDLAKAYNDAFSAISDIFSNLSLSFSNLEPFFTQSSYSGDESDIDYYCGVVAFYSHYQKASKEKEEQFLHFKEKYQNLRKDFLLISNKTERATLEQWLNLTLNFTQEFADFLREVRDQISFYKRIVKEENLKIPISENITDSQYNTLQNLVSLLDQKISTIHTLSKTIDQLKNSISNLENEIKIQTDTLGQKEKDLQDAKENYENCFIKSPISGIVSKVQVKIGDNISQGTVLASLISKEKIVEISLNEIDAAKVKPGQKATLTFDAIEGLTLTGQVSEIDTVGTVSQGVVNFGVKITLDSDDERIKPGMSVTANIIVNIKTDTLILPKSAIKSEAGNYYVELVELPKEKIREYLQNKAGVVLPVQPKRQIVEIGISNDTQVEILSGLKEGDVVVSSVVTPTTQLQRVQRFQIPGMGGQIRMR